MQKYLFYTQEIEFAVANHSQTQTLPFLLVMTKVKTMGERGTMTLFFYFLFLDIFEENYVLYKSMTGLFFWTGLGAKLCMNYMNMQIQDSA